MKTTGAAGRKVSSERWFSMWSKEPTLREQMIRSGDADFTYNLPFDSYAALASQDDLVVDTTPSFQMLYGLLNTQQAPLDDLRVREALSYAFPYEVVRDNLYGAQGTIPAGAVPSRMWGALGEGGGTYDLERAKALLEEAGHAGRLRPQLYLRRRRPRRAAGR